MKIVIIEDEKLTAKDLKRTILGIEPDIEIAALLHSVEEGIEYFNKNTDTDLIFSDIQLGDGLSFEIFKKVGLQVIFCTAYNNYFAEAFQVTGIDYLLKPFTKATVEKALLKYQTLQKNFLQKKDEYPNLLELLETKLSPKKNAIIVRQRDKIIPLDVSGIALLYIDNGCTFAHTFSQERFMVKENLEELENSFGSAFFRANRQYLVNRKAIKDASNFFNRKIVVNLSFPFKSQILVGKLKTTAFIEWLSEN
jgi:two-component system, LytTR family, response regulator LytT